MATAAQPEVGMSVATIERRPLPASREHADVNFGDLMALAKELVPTGFLPKHIKTAGQCVAIILSGREMGMGPMRALRSLQMVEGKVVESADSQLARFKTDGGRAVFRALTEKEAVLWLRHPNGDEHIERFTIEDAGRVGLLGKDNWKKYPKAMLRSRVITAGLKSVGWEGGAGNYDPEEAQTSFAPTLVVPELQQTVEAAGDEAEAAALTEIEALLPSLTLDQQIYVRGKLSDGADPVKLLDVVKYRVSEGKRSAGAPVSSGTTPASSTLSTGSTTATPGATAAPTTSLPTGTHRPKTDEPTELPDFLRYEDDDLPF